MAEIDKIASAWKDVGGVMELFGYTVEDVLNDTPGAFEAFESAYIACLGNMNGQNDQYIQGLAEATGKSVDEIKALMGTMEDFGKSATEPMKDTGEAVKDVGDKAQAASTGVGNFATKAGEAAEKSGELKSNLEGVPEGLDSISNIDGTKLDPLVANLQSIATLLGGEDGTGGLIASISELTSNPELLTPLIDQFNLLTEAINGAVTALGGGGGGESGGGPDFVGNTNAQVSAMQNAGGEGGGSGLSGAIQAVKESASQNIGEAVAEEGSEGDGTVIGDFGALTTTIGKASTAIGTLDSEADAGDLIGSIVSLGQKNTEVINGGEGGVGLINEWTDFNKQLSEAEDHVTKMVEGLGNLDPQYETTLKVNLEITEGGFSGLGGGGGHGFGGNKYTGTATRGNAKGFYEIDVLEAIGLPNEPGTWESIIRHNATGTASFGNARLSGDWAYEGGKTLIAEIGPELVVYPDGHFRTFDTPQLVNLPRGSVIFNHKQTNEILDTKNQVHSLSGKSNLNGTLPSNLTPLSQANPEAFNTLVQNAELLRANTEDMKADLADIGYATDDIRQAVQNITNNTNMGVTITFGDLQFTCNGITSAEVLDEVGNALQREFQGITLNAYQRAVNMA